MSDTHNSLDELRDALRGQIEALAESLLGERNKAISNRRTLRFGSKGSTAVEIAGPKRGTWFNHEAGKGGGPLDLIRHVRGGELKDAINWARTWVGQDTSTRPAPVARPVPAPEDDTERQAAIADARRIWANSRPIAGTVAEKYLTETRKIPTPPNGWPGMVIRYFASELAIVFAATRLDGTVQAVQRIRLGRDGLKANDGRPVKLSRGPQDGALVRLPGDPAGPLLIAEGPETGLSVWRATGLETWITLGLMSRAELPVGRRVVICADDDRRRAIKGKDANAHKRLNQAVASWKTAELDVIVAYPWPTRRENKSDFNDTLQAEGLDAVRARIMTALDRMGPAVERVPIEVARVELAKAVDGFMDRALSWVPPDETAVPPVEAIRVDVGAEKSDAARRSLVRVVRDLRASGDRRTAAILVPTHRLGDEQVQRIEDLPDADGLKIRVWRGRAAQNPNADNQTMCRDLRAVEDAESVGQDPQTAVCKRELPDGTVAACPFFETCAYQAQRNARPDIWLAAHQLLFTEKPAAFGNLAGLVIDESFWQAGLKAETQFPIDLLETDKAVVPGDPLNTDRLKFLRQRLLDVLRNHEDGAVIRDRLVAADFTADNCGEAYAMEWSRKVVADMVPGMSAEARREAAAAAMGNRNLMRLAGLWRAVGALVADGGPEASGWITLAQDQDGARIVKLTGRSEIAKGWRVPTLILDAIVNPSLVRPYFQQVQVVAALAVATPHQRVRQVTDRAYSLAMLTPLDPKQTKPEEVKRRARNLADLRVRLILEARRVAPGRVLVVLQKRVEAALLELGALPPNVETAHHNAIAGRDEWGDVALLVLVGRTLPGPGAITRDAEALTGAALPLLTGWYDRADAIRETVDGGELTEADRHPDPLAEAIRWQICEGELVQIIGRGRGVNRTAENPLDVLVLCDVPLPMPVAEMMPAAALDPSLADHMQAAGGVTLENAGHAFRAYPHMWPTDRAASKAMERERSATNPYKRILIGECRTPLVRVAYQVAGPGQKPAVAWCDPVVVPNPADWLTARLGRLAWCDAAGVAPEPPAHTRAAVIQPEILDDTSGWEPSLVYRGPVIEMPPADLLVVRGGSGAPVAMIEAPAMGAFMGARSVTAAGLGPWIMLRRPPPDDLQIPHPAFIQHTLGGHRHGHTR